AGAGVGAGDAIGVASGGGAVCGAGATAARDGDIVADWAEVGRGALGRTLLASTPPPRGAPGVCGKRFMGSARIGTRASVLPPLPDSGRVYRPWQRPDHPRRTTAPATGGYRQAIVYAGPGPVPVGGRTGGTISPGFRSPAGLLNPACLPHTFGWE